MVFSGKPSLSAAGAHTGHMVLTKPVIQTFIAQAHKRSYSPKHTILHAGDTPTTLFLILEGSVSILLEDKDGREIVLAYLSPGDFFGEMCLFPNVTSRSAMVQTLDECMVLEIPYQRFLDLSAKHSSLWLELAGQIAARLRAVNRRLAEMPVIPAAERIWSTLLDLAEHSGDSQSNAPITLRVTREDLGRLAGCSREMAGLVLRDFERAGRVQLNGHRITVPPRTAAPVAP